MSTNSPNTSLLDASKLPASDTTPAPLALNPRLVSFIEKAIQPPSRVYITRDDQIFISCVSSIAPEIVTVRYKILLPDGSLSDNQQVIALPTAYSPNIATAFFTAAEGFLLSMGFSCQSALKRGVTFVRAGIARKSITLSQVSEVLIADYISSTQPIGWPEGQLWDCTDRTGNLRLINIANPAAGVDWTVTIPINTRWNLRHVFATLTTSAAAANRNPRLQVTAGGAAVFRSIQSLADQLASLANNYSIGGSAVAATVAGATNVWGVDTPIVLDEPSATTLRVSTANIQAADQWSNVAVVVEEWLQFI